MASTPLPTSPSRTQVCLVGQLLAPCGVVDDPDEEVFVRVRLAWVEACVLDGVAVWEEIAPSSDPGLSADFPPPLLPITNVMTTTNRTATMANMPSSQAARRRRSVSPSGSLSSTTRAPSPSAWTDHQYA